MTCIVAHVMQPVYTEDHILETERHIKLFLAAFENMDKLLRDTKMLPKWISAYNFLCLLNLSGMMRGYGPLRNLYESSLGEIFLVLVKPRTNGIRDKWHMSVMRNILQRKAFAMVRGNVGPNGSQRLLSAELDAMLFGPSHEDLPDSYGINRGHATPSKRKWKSVKLKVYSSMKEIQEEFDDGRPVSGIYLKNTSEFAVRILCNNYMEDGLHILASVGEIRKRIGMVYTTWEGTTGKVVKWDEDVSGQHSHVIVLPWLEADCNGVPEWSSPHTVVDDDWKNLDENMNMSLPHFTRWFP
jgi:hypothetical protein